MLVSSGAEEDSWFWSTETDAYTGTGYFTAALENALRASDPEQIDPDGNGTVTLPELTARLREIHGASTVYCWPEESGEKLFHPAEGPEDREPIAGRGLRGAEQDGDAWCCRSASGRGEGAGDVSAGSSKEWEMGL